MKCLHGELLHDGTKVRVFHCHDGLHHERTRVGWLSWGVDYLLQRCVLRQWLCGWMAERMAEWMRETCLVAEDNYMGCRFNFFVGGGGVGVGLVLYRVCGWVG